MLNESAYWDGEIMARQPQAWPVEHRQTSSALIEENELFILGLLLSFNELYRHDNPRLLRELLPTLKGRVQRIYQGARQIEEAIDGQTKPPLWAKLAREIIAAYPEILAELKAIEPDLRSNRFIKVRPVLVSIFNAAAGIHVRLLKIPGGKMRYVLQLENLSLIAREIR